MVILVSQVNPAISNALSKILVNDQAMCRIRLAMIVVYYQTFLLEQSYLIQEDTMQRPFFPCLKRLFL